MTIITGYCRCGAPKVIGVCSLLIGFVLTYLVMFAAGFVLAAMFPPK